MLTLRGIITLIVLIVLFALAVVWISKQGGWKGEGCGGNCASCHSHCEKQDPNKKPEFKNAPDIACWQRPGAFCFQLSVSR